MVNNHDSNKKLYRIIPFDSLLYMLNDEENILVKTSKWDYVYENSFLKENFHINGVRKDFTPVINRFFGNVGLVGVLLTLFGGYIRLITRVLESERQLRKWIPSFKELWTTTSFFY